MKMEISYKKNAREKNKEEQKIVDFHKNDFFYHIYISSCNLSTIINGK